MSNEHNNLFTNSHNEIITVLRNEVSEIKTELIKEIEQIKKSTGVDGARYGNAKDAARLFGVSANTIRNWGRKKDIQKCIVGSVSLYGYIDEITKSMEDIQRFMDTTSLTRGVHYFVEGGAIYFSYKLLHDPKNEVITNPGIKNNKVTNISIS